MGVMKGGMRGFFSPAQATLGRELLTLPFKRRVRERVDLKDFMIRGALRIGRTLMGR